MVNDGQWWPVELIDGWWSKPNSLVVDPAGTHPHQCLVNDGNNSGVAYYCASKDAVSNIFFMSCCICRHWVSRVLGDQPSEAMWSLHCEPRSSWELGHPQWVMANQNPNDTYVAYAYLCQNAQWWHCILFIFGPILPALRVQFLYASRMYRPYVNISRTFPDASRILSQPTLT